VSEQASIASDSGAASPEAVDTRPSTPEARAGAARIRLRQEAAEATPEADTPETAPEDPTATVATSPASEAASDETAAPDDNAALIKAKQVRAARLAALREAEHERAERERERKFAASPEAERLRNLETLDKRLSDPREFFAIAQERGLTAKQLAEYLRESIESPEKVEASRVKAEISAEVAALRAELEAERAQRAEVERVQQEAEVAQELLTRTLTERKVAPYSARFLERQGREAFIKYAEKVVEHLPPGCGIEALHDAIEHNLESLAVVYGSDATTQPRHSTAAAKAPHQTITNALAATRTTVGDEEAEADGPRPSLEERVQRARQKARRGVI
jgi:hypothetical protein